MRIAAVMCTWQRIDRLPITLDLLAGQSSKDFSFFIWNNNPDYATLIDELVSARNLPYPITVHHSPENIGGFGRFEWGKRLLDISDASHLIFFDDDQEFSPEMVSGFAAEAAPQTISSRWSFRFTTNGHYWERLRSHSGEPAHYCGTGGLIMDISLFKDEGFFAECPDRFRFVEDLWLSFYAHHRLGWNLVASSVHVKTIADEKDHYLKLRQRKIEFLEYLRGLGWRV